MKKLFASSIVGLAMVFGLCAVWQGDAYAAGKRVQMNFVSVYMNRHNTVVNGFKPWMKEIVSGHPTLLRAAVVNFLNPNPWLGWSLVMGPLFLRGYREAPINGLALIGGFYTTMVTCLVGVISLFAFARRLGPRVTKVTLGLSVIALTGFGLYQLWLGIGTG